MRGSKAKRLRREIYGDDYSPRYRQYKSWNGTIRADERRQAYQAAKK